MNLVNTQLVKCLALGCLGAPHIETIHWNNGHKDKAALWWQFGHQSWERQHTPVFSGARQVVQPSSVQCRQQLLQHPQVTLLSPKLLDNPTTKLSYQVGIILLDIIREKRSCMDSSKRMGLVIFVFLSFSLSHAQLKAGNVTAGWLWGPLGAAKASCLQPLALPSALLLMCKFSSLVQRVPAHSSVCEVFVFLGKEEFDVFSSGN